MGTDCAPLLANLFLFFYEYEYIKVNFVQTIKKQYFSNILLQRYDRKQFYVTSRNIPKVPNCKMSACGESDSEADNEEGTQISTDMFWQ